MAFQQALSGLNSASKAIDATSHNIANSSTVGFKASSAHFGDVYAASLNGAGASQIGVGVGVVAVQQQFAQGNITSTNNPLDISINGAGFFRMDQDGVTTYSRNGQFHLDKNGFVINDQSMKLTGYAVQNSVIAPSTPGPLQISASDLKPVETGTGTSLGFQGVKANLQLDSRDTGKDPASVGAAAVAAFYAAAGVTAATATPAQVTAATAAGTAATAAAPVFDPKAPLTYNYSTALSIYDSLGNPHNLTMYFVKNANQGEWEVHMNVDGTSEANVNVGVAGLLHFDKQGKLDSGSPMNVNIDLDAVNTALGLPLNAKSPIGTATGFSLDFTGSTQYGSKSGNNSLTQDGYTSGHLVGLSAGADGVIQGRYSNGQTLAQGQIVLANFTNPNGLQSLGNNQWNETSTSGAALVGAPNTSNLGGLSSSSVEESNVDLTFELVNLITQQRNYQANAQSIKTQDQIMQTLVNLR